MDIKDSYLHSTVGVVKSIDVEGDKLKYNLADKNNTEKTVILPLATQETNGLLSKEDKIIIDSVSELLAKPHYLENLANNVPVGWVRVFSGTYQDYGLLSIKHGNVKLTIDFINNYSSDPYLKYINGIPVNILSKIRFIRSGDNVNIDIYNNSVNTITVSFYSNDIRYIPSLPITSVPEDVSSYTVYEHSLQLGNWSNMPYKSSLFIGDLKGTADIATKLGTNTLGSINKPIYLNQGVPTECNNVISSDSVLTEGNLLIGNNDKNIKPLTNGTNSQVMTMVEGKPAWADNIAQGLKNPNIQTTSVNLSTEGWKRLIINNNIGNSGLGTIKLSNQHVYNPSSSLNIDFGFEYGSLGNDFNKACYINIYGISTVFTKVRIVNKPGVFNYLDIYYDKNSVNTIYAMLIAQNSFNYAFSITSVPDDENLTGCNIYEYIIDGSNYSSIPYKSNKFIGNLQGIADNVAQSETTATDIPFLLRDSDGNVKYNTNFSLNKFNEYLPKTGGTMSGNVDMSGNEIKNTNFELVESFPTENLYEGRQVTYDGKIYTYHNGKWISTADDLGDLKETLSSEFVFRPTADTHSIKDEFASVKSIKGNTVVWNQFSKPSLWVAGEGATSTYDINTGVHTLTTVNAQYNRDLRMNATFAANHKYLIKCTLKSNYDGYGHIFFYPSGLDYMFSLTNGIKKHIKTILQKPNNQDSTTVESLRISILDNTSEAGKTLEIKNIQLIDLTQMLGEGNEPTSVEEFEKFYSHLPADYNEGSLLNLNADSIKSVGFNQWDEEWESGMIGHDGNVVNQPNTICSKNYIKVLPDTDYFFKVNNAGYYACFDENYKNIYPDNAYLTPMAGLKRIPGDCRYIKFFVYDTSIYNNDICINLSHNGERNGEYQSYEEHIVNLPIKEYFPDGMKSAGTAYDEIVFDKNIGKYKAIQRIGSVDMGTLNWIISSNGASNVFITSHPGIKRHSSIKPNALIVKYTPVNFIQHDFSSYTLDKVIDINSTYQGFDNICVRDTSYTDATSFKESLNGLILYYELKTPIETIIDDYDLIAYKANDWGTEEILSEEPTTPIKADIEYNFDSNEIIKYNYFRIDDFRKNYLPKDGIAISAEKLARPVKLWGNNFDGSYDVNGIINYGLKINNTEDRISLLNIESVVANINYSHLYVTSTNGSNPVRPLVLLNGYGNVGIGLENPTEKLEVLGNVKATSFKGNLDGNYINKLTNYTKAESIGSISTTDTLNIALGKLEYKTDFIYNDLFGTDNDEIINKWNEIVDFIGSITEGTDITDLFVTRTTNQTITGLKTFSNNIILYNNTTEPPYIRFQRNTTTDDWFDYYIKVETGGIKFGYSSIDETFINIATVSTSGISASKFITAGGTFNLFVKGDGSLDSNKYLIAPNNITNSYVRSINVNGNSYNFLSNVNNSLSTTIYGPATSGTQGLIVISSGEGASVWANQSSLITNWNKYIEKSVKLFTKKWTRVLLFNNSDSFLLNIHLLQNSQSCINTYLINSGWHYSKIIQLGYNNYSANYEIELRICRESSDKFYLDIYNPYGYNNALETNHDFKLINILSGNVSFLTESLDVTNSTETVVDSLISSYNYASNFKSHYSLLSDNSSKLEGSTKNELLQSASSDAASKYLPLTGGTLTGSLNISRGYRLNIYNSYCKLSLTSVDESNFIQSASNDFSSNKPLYITGPNGNTGSDLYLKFNNIYCRNNYINLDSDNYSSYSLPLTGGTLSGPIHRTYSNNSSEGDVWICPKDAPQFGIRYFAGDVDKMAISASGNNTSISASDLCINGKGDGTVTIRGNSILHEGNYDSIISSKYSFHKTYSTLSELPEGTEGWYKIGKVMDSSGSPSLFMIRAYAHTSTIFTVVKGFSTGHITVLNSTTSSNALYAYIKAIRIIDSGEVEILLNKPSANNSTYVEISISMYNSDNIKLYDTLTLNTNSEITILDSKTLQNNCIISDKFSGEFNLKNVNSEDNCVPSNNSVQFFRTNTTSNSGDSGYIQSFSWSSGSFVTQMFFDADLTHKVFLRNRSGEGVWNEWKQFAFIDSNITGSAAKLTSTKIINEQSFTLNNTKWENTGYTFANLESGTYAIQITSGTNLVASGIMSVYKNLSDTIGDEIPLHVYGTAGWRPYLRTYENKLQISSNDIENTSRIITIKIALII